MDDKNEIIKLLCSVIDKTDRLNKRCVTSVAIAIIAVCAAFTICWAVYQLAPSNYGTIQYACGDENNQEAGEQYEAETEQTNQAYEAGQEVGAE